MTTRYVVRCPVFAGSKLIKLDTYHYRFAGDAYRKAESLTGAKLYKVMAGAEYELINLEV